MKTINKEYITLEEALTVTGLAEKTLRDHMRNTVTAIGRNACDREEFFEYWKKLKEEKQHKSEKKSKRRQELVKNIIDRVRS